MAKSKIIIQIANNEISTEIALKRLKVLLSNFDNEKLLHWVNNELNGYGIGEEIPDYRKSFGSLRGTFMNYTIKATNVNIPIRSDAPDALRTVLNTIEIRDNISTLQMLLDSGKTSFEYSIPSDYLPNIQYYSAITMTALLSAHIAFSPGLVTHIMASVNNIVLDALLLLEKEFGNLDDLDVDTSSKSEQQLSAIVQQLIFNIYNDSSIKIGDKNTIKESMLNANDSN